MEKLLSSVGSLLYGMRFTMLFFYVGLVAIIFGILGKFLLETYKLFTTLMFDDLQKIDLIIKVLELVDMTMVAQLVWVVALAESPTGSTTSTPTTSSSSWPLPSFPSRACTRSKPTSAVN